MIRTKTILDSLILVILLVVSIGFCSAQNTEIKISSDSSTIDLANKVMIYKGHTIFTGEDITINGDELRVFKKDDDSTNIQVTGSPVKLLQNTPSLNQVIELYAHNIEYNLDKKNIRAKNNITLNQKTTDTLNPENNRIFNVIGDELSFSSDSQGIIRMKGSPLQLSIEDKKNPINAKARELLYNQETQAFELIGDVSLETESNTIKNAEKILYDGKIIQIPESQNQSVQMTQTIKDTHE